MVHSPSETEKARMLMQEYIQSMDRALQEIQAQRSRQGYTGRECAMPFPTELIAFSEKK